VSQPLRPVLVVMVWQGRERFQRCLASIDKATAHFSRIVLSITATPDSADLALAHEFAESHPGVEVICTGKELPTMQHQTFWVDYLERTGTTPDDWIYWLAYDDEVRVRGIERIIDADGSWPLQQGTAYFGPWAMRHEAADRVLWDESGEHLQSWTSFPLNGPLRLPVGTWIGRQLAQPTYMQMSGSLAQFACYLSLRDARPRKDGPMRIEMSIAAAPPNIWVEEFPAPISIIYGRSNSDRASYGSAARKEDFHLVAWLGRHALEHPEAIVPLTKAAAEVGWHHLLRWTRGAPLPAEDWATRDLVEP